MNLPIGRRSWRSCCLGLVGACLLAGCVALKIDDCPSDGHILGNNDLGSARLRTSHYRVLLAHPETAAKKFLPYAVMSAYAYHQGTGCPDAGKGVKIDEARRTVLLAYLGETTDDVSRWKRRDDLGPPNECEDSEGLMFHVWERVEGRQKFVVIAYRGTSGPGDWSYGNLWPLTHFVHGDNQFTRARASASAIIAGYLAEARGAGAPVPRFVTTGHSLGGGLAEHVMYAQAKVVEQAIVFDPSSITAYTSLDDEQKRDGCACGVRDKPEVRIVRVYQTYEILTNLRIFHKLAFPPERHVQEVRFPFAYSGPWWDLIRRHSMQDFASNLASSAGPFKHDDFGIDWTDSQSAMCTAKVKREQTASCAIGTAPGDWTYCPQ